MHKAAILFKSRPNKIDMIYKVINPGTLNTDYLLWHTGRYFLNEPLCLVPAAHVLNVNFYLDTLGKCKRLQSELSLHSRTLRAFLNLHCTFDFHEFRIIKTCEEEESSECELSHFRV